MYTKEMPRKTPDYFRSSWSCVALRRYSTHKLQRGGRTRARSRCCAFSAEPVEYPSGRISSRMLSRRDGVTSQHPVCKYTFSLNKYVEVTCGKQHLYPSAEHR